MSRPRYQASVNSTRALQHVEQPRPRVGPFASHGTFRQVQRRGRFRLAEAGIEAQPDHVGGPGVGLDEPLEGLVDGEDLVDAVGGGEVHTSQRHPLHCTTMHDPAARTRVIDEDPTHRLGRCHEELRAIHPAVLTIAGDAQERLVHERSRLQGMPGSLLRHAMLREPVELRVSNGQQLVCCQCPRIRVRAVGYGRQRIQGQGAHERLGQHSRRRRAYRSGHWFVEQSSGARLITAC
jgi:hypothetical protein